MKIYSFIFLWITTVHLYAQNESPDTSFLDRTDFKIGYYGNIIWDNGIAVGAEYAWKKYINVKERKRGQKIITHQFLFNGSLGYSTNFATQTDNGLSTHYGMIWRRTNPKGKQYNVELNPLGYYRSFLPETYEVKGDDVSKVSLPGRGYYAPSIAIGIGKYRKEKTRSGWYLNLQCTLRTNYNAGTLPIISLHYGHRFNFKRKK